MRFRLRAALAVWVTGSAVAGCSAGPEQPILQQFFSASRLRDRTSLQTFATVAFEPHINGIVTRFEISSVGPEERQPLVIRALAKAHDDARAEEAELMKRKNRYQNGNIEAIRRVLNAEGAKAQVHGKDADVQAAWTRFREESAQISKKVSAARSRLAAERSVAELSVEDPRNPVDLTTYDGDLVSKEVTISAPVKMPDAQTVGKTLVVTMRRAVLRGNKQITGRWIITGISG